MPHAEEVWEETRLLLIVVIECACTAVKIIYRPWLQKFVSTVQAHSLARVQGMVYIVLSMSKGAGHGLNGRTLTQQKINSMDQIE